MWILDELEKITDPRQKKVEAFKYLKIFSRPVNRYIPNGVYFIEDREPYGRHTDKIKEYLKNDDHVFEVFDDIFDGKFPDLYKSIKEEYFDNRNTLLNLISMKKEERMNLPILAFPPYHRINAFLARSLKSTEKSFVEGLAFNKNPIGGGTFSEIYKGEDIEENAYALKLFKPDFRFNHYMDGWVKRTIDLCFKNIYRIKELVQEDPFTKLVLFPKQRDNYDEWYIMEYFDGTSVQDKLNDEHFKKNEELLAKIMTTYGAMLKKVHNKQLVFLDNGWHSVLVGNENAELPDVKICDYDTMFSTEKIREKHINMMKPNCASREQLLGEGFSVHSDIECLAQMIERLFNNTDYIKTKSYAIQQNFVNAAKKNKRTYPKRRQANLPHHIRQVVVPLLNYPRDDSISLDDVISAIRQDFKA